MSQNYYAAQVDHSKAVNHHSKSVQHISEIMMQILTPNQEIRPAIRDECPSPAMVSDAHPSCLMEHNATSWCTMPKARASLQHSDCKSDRRLPSWRLNEIHNNKPN